MVCWLNLAAVCLSGRPSRRLSSGMDAWVANLWPSEGLFDGGTNVVELLVDVKLSGSCGRDRRCSGLCGWASKSGTISGALSIIKVSSDEDSGFDI